MKTHSTDFLEIISLASAFRAGIFAVLFSASLSLSGGAEYTSRWIGPQGAPWRNAANWETKDGNGTTVTGKVPNNSGGDTYDVALDGKGPTLDTQASVRNIRIAMSPSTSVLTVSKELMVEGDFSWTSGELRAPTAITVMTIKVQGTAILEATPPKSLTLERTTLELAGASTMAGPIRMFASATIVNEGKLELKDGADFQRVDNSNAKLSNLQAGRIEVIAGAVSSDILFENKGQMLIDGGICNIGAQGAIIQSGGSLEVKNGGRIEGLVGSDRATSGILSGNGYIRSGVIGQNDTLKGSLEFDDLRFTGSTSQNEYSVFECEIRSRTDFDKVTVNTASLGGGRLNIRLVDGVENDLMPDDRFEMIQANAPGGLSGLFLNTISGQRVQTLDGKGSFAFEVSDHALILRDFRPTAVPNVSFSEEQILYPLLEGEASAPPVPLLLDPFAAVAAPANSDWDGASITVRILGDHMNLPERIFIIPTLDLEPGAITSFFNRDIGFYVETDPTLAKIVLNSAATTFAVQTILRSVAYTYSQAFSGPQMSEPETYPSRDLEITITAGPVSRVFHKTVQFPQLADLYTGAPKRTICYSLGKVNVEMSGRFANEDFGFEKVVRLRNLNFSTQQDPTIFPVHPSAGTLGVDPVVGDLCSDFIVTAGRFQSAFTICSEDCQEVQDDQFRGQTESYKACWGILLELIFHVHFPQPFHAAPMSLHSATSDLSAPAIPTLRTLEALLAETSEGRRLKDLYWAFTGEVSSITLADPALALEMIKVVGRFQPAVAALLSGKGKDAIITAEMVSDLNSVWSKVADRASLALKATLEMERARSHNFQDFVGKDFTQWAQMLSIPAPTKPFVFTSNASLGAGHFSIEANYVEGYDFTLWKSPEVAPSVWQRVADSAAAIDGLTIRLTDPNPASERTFYQVRAEQKQAPP